MQMIKLTGLGVGVGFYYSKFDEWNYVGIRRFCGGNLIYLHVGKLSVEVNFQPDLINRGTKVI